MVSILSKSNFFDTQTEQSRIKSLIVTKYFDAWSQIMLRQARNPIQYMDLFAGPGQYDDGTPSTPLIVLKKVIAYPKLRGNLQTIFNDEKPQYVDSLRNAINSLPGIETLRYKPIVKCLETGEGIVQILENTKMPPTFFFADPFGYKGISLSLLSAAIKDFGSDCVLFFNYNRIKAAIDNSTVESRMVALFGQERLLTLRQKCDGVSPHEREMFVVDEMCNAIRDAIPSRNTTSGKSYVLPFRFRDGIGTRTSHHLIFITEHIRGYEIMKDIMSRESSIHEQGVPTFEYNAASIRQPFLFEFNRPLDDLAEMLLIKFAGRVLTMKEVFQEHHVDTRYVEKNYKDVLNLLEASDRIKVEPPAEIRPKRNGVTTLKDDAVITFPGRD